MAFELPDGQKITLDKERYECSEILFQPHLMGVDSIGIHEAIYNSIQKCDPTWLTRANLYGNIVLLGGTTLLGNNQDSSLAARLCKEMSQLGRNFKVKVIASPERRYYNWIGASMLANLSSFLKECISKAEYSECGASIVHTKCV